jgi:hypothetical protein
MQLESKNLIRSTTAPVNGEDPAPVNGEDPRVNSNQVILQFGVNLSC